MKKLVFLMAALAIVGCSKQGGTEDQYNSNTGGSRSSTSNYNVSPDINSPSSTTTNSSSTSTNTPSLPQ